MASDCEGDAAGCGADPASRAGATPSAGADAGIAPRPREDGFDADDGRWAHTRPPVVPPTRRATSEIVLSFLSHMIFKTPCVRDRTRADTSGAVAEPIAAATVDSSRGEPMAVGGPASQFARQDRRRDLQPAAFQSRPQESPPAREPAAHRTDRPSKQLGRLLVRLAFEVAEHDDVPELVREPIQLLVEQRPKVEMIGVVRRRPGGLLDPDGVHGAVSRGDFPGPPGRAIGHAAEPGCERLVDPDRASLAHQDQEGGLERVVGVVPMPQQLPADRQDHRPVTMHQLAERRFGHGVASAAIHVPTRSCESLNPVSVPDAQSLSSWRPASPAFPEFIAVRPSRLTVLLR